MLTHTRVPWHVILAAVIAALLITALPQAAEAATKRQRCIAAAEKALGHDIDPSDYRIVLGTDRRVEELWTSRGKDLICGFGGREDIPKGAVIRPGDIFISGKGRSIVWAQTGGLVIGGNGHNMVLNMHGGRFEGRANSDSVDGLHGGVFFGGDGADFAIWMTDGGRFAGGRGADVVGSMYGGTFRGKRGADCVHTMSGGAFYGGNGPDSVLEHEAGELISAQPRDLEMCPGDARRLRDQRGGTSP